MEHTNDQRQGASERQGSGVNFRVILSNHMSAIFTASGDMEDAKSMLLTARPAAMQTDLIG